MYKKLDRMLLKDERMMISILGLFIELSNNFYWMQEDELRDVSVSFHLMQTFGDIIID